uniref:Uncharacterized protein n=1 Tax=Panagrellus redivivus TaxID=6233 RepID=A0A7E4ZWK2_PANRE
MHCYRVVQVLIFVVSDFVRANNIAKEVKGGVELLNTGPIQLIVPEVLSFTIKTGGRCTGAFTICYVSKSKGSREELKRQKYWNVGSNCPPDMCTLIIEPIGGIMGLAMEEHDGKIHGIFDDTAIVICPREVVDGLFNFTVVDLPECPVIVDGAALPKDEAVNSKSNTSVKWVVIICVVLVLLILAILAIAVYLCMRPKRKPILRANSVKHVQQLSNTPKSASIRSTFPIHKPSKTKPDVVLPSPTTPTMENETSSRQSKPTRKLPTQHLDLSDSDTSNK